MHHPGRYLPSIILDEKQIVNKWLMRTYAELNKEPRAREVAGLSFWRGHCCRAGKFMQRQSVIAKWAKSAAIGVRY
jgi:hypothetical protein